MSNDARGPFVDPPWAAELDEAACLRAIPQSATMTGMFLDGAAKLAREKGHAIPSARDRYTPFQTYPLREHCQILVEVARALYPNASLREGLRKLGRGAPNVLLRSTVGRVVLGSVEGPHATIEAMARSYTMHMRPSTLAVERRGERAVVVHLSDVHNFLDSHNVGVFEGVLKHMGLTGTVRICTFTRTSADFLCAW